MEHIDFPLNRIYVAAYAIENHVSDYAVRTERFISVCQMLE